MFKQLLYNKKHCVLLRGNSRLLWFYFCACISQMVIYPPNVFIVFSYYDVLGHFILFLCHTSLTSGDNCTKTRISSIWDLVALSVEILIWFSIIFELLFENIWIFIVTHIALKKMKTCQWKLNKSFKKKVGFT